MVKEYVNGAGYRIRASEKAYNLLYKKNGFLPAETAGTDMGENPTDDTSFVDGDEGAGRESTDGNPEKTSGGKKASGRKSRKVPTVQDGAEQFGDGEASPDTERTDDAAHQDTAEQPEDK